MAKSFMDSVKSVNSLKIAEQAEEAKEAKIEKPIAKSEAPAKVVKKTEPKVKVPEEAPIVLAPAPLKVASANKAGRKPIRRAVYIKRTIELREDQLELLDQLAYDNRTSKREEIEKALDMYLKKSI